MKRYVPVITAIAIHLSRRDGFKTGIMSKTTLLIIAGILWLLFFVLCLNAGAQERLSIMPTRIVFDNEQSSREITITNKSADTLRYAVSFVEMYMKDNGRLVAGNAYMAGVNPASQYMTVSPEKVELAPGQTKTLTITLSSTQLTEGESRSHILLKREQTAGIRPTDTPKSKNKNLCGPMSVTLPVIVRKGAYDARLSLSNMTLVSNGDAPVISVTLSRSGSMSAFGNVVVHYTDSAGNAVTAATIKGVAIYTPNTHRQFRVPLKKLPGQEYNLSRLNVEFIAGEKNLLPVASNEALAIQKK
jgi:P pilus assembly chaperone PapD